MVPADAADTGAILAPLPLGIDTDSSDGAGGAFPRRGELAAGAGAAALGAVALTGIPLTGRLGRNTLDSSLKPLFKLKLRGATDAALCAGDHDVKVSS